MFSSEFEWEKVAEMQFLLSNQSCLSCVSQLAQIWCRFCPSVNRRIACTHFLNEQNTAHGLFEQIIANLSPIPSDLEAKLWRSPTIMQLIPKSHFHNKFSDRCFEVAEFGGDGQKEFAAVFRSAQLSSSSVPIESDHHFTMERDDRKCQNPHITSTYAFHLVKTTSMRNLTETDGEDGRQIGRHTNACLKLWCNPKMPPAQIGFLLKWLWPRLQKWVHKIDNDDSSAAVHPLLKPKIGWADGDNQLLSDQKAYTDRYWRLKLTFGHQQQQRTNLEEKQKHCGPLNYECCAVAAYLLELWKIDGVGPRRGFVDLECGKGILAHLLQVEGVPGVGVHRKEKPQWAAFKCQGTRLIELPLMRDISMADEIQNSVHDGVDFLIGNRCDQMIPWIPLIAAKLRCNFFLLPNIPTNFHSNFGKRIVAKYEQLPSGRLEQFYAFLEQTSKMLGFRVATDQLKIPSKRRKCLIGIVPPNGLPNSDELDQIIGQLLSLESTTDCSKQTKKELLPNTNKHLLLNAKIISGNECFIDLSRRIVAHLISKDSDRNLRNWHCGGTAKVEEIAKNVLNDEHRFLLSGIRNGLLSFLQRQRQLFVLLNGTVSLRFWPSDYQQFEREKRRNFQCLFQQIHPDGCPLEPEKCPYKHI